MPEKVGKGDKGGLEGPLNDLLFVGAEETLLISWFCLKAALRLVLQLWAEVSTLKGHIHTFRVHSFTQQTVPEAWLHARQCEGPKNAKGRQDPDFKEPLDRRLDNIPS